MRYKIDYSLYLVTDRTLMSTDTLEEAVEQAIAGGCTMVQLREKDMGSLDFYTAALSVKKITDRFQIPLIINDRVDIAMAVDAAGVHVGQGDLPAETVRRLIGKNKLLGVSAATREESVKAEAEGADYLGIGAMFTTATKSDIRLVTMEELKKIRQAVKVPIVVIGGIGLKTAPLFQGSGINGFAVVSDVIAREDIAGAAEKLKGAFCQLVSAD